MLDLSRCSEAFIDFLKANPQAEYEVKALPAVGFHYCVVFALSSLTNLSNLRLIREENNIAILILLNSEEIIVDIEA